MVAVFGADQPHNAYVFANRKANRLKILVDDGIGIWLAARSLERVKLEALVLGPPWQRVGQAGVITVV